MDSPQAKLKKYFIALETFSKAVLLTIIIGGGVVAAQFSEPSLPPVSGDVDVVNTGSAKQTKTGGLWTQAIATDLGGKICLNDDANCKTDWSSNQSIGNCHVESSQVINTGYWPVDVRYVSSCDAMTTPASQAAGWVNTGSNYHTVIAGKNALPPSVCVFMRLVCNGITVTPAISTVHTAYPIANFTKSANQCSDGKNNEPSFTKLSDTNITGGFPTGPGFGGDFSPSGNHVAVAHSNPPYVSIYKRTGDTFAKLTPSANPTGTGRRVSFSPDGMFLAVSQDAAPYITIYSISGDTFTKLTSQPNTSPTGTTRGIAFSPDSQYLAIAQNGGSPYLHIYKRSGSTFTKLLSPNGPNVQPAGAAYGVDFSPDGTYLAIAHDGAAQSTTVYKRIGDQFVALSTPGFAFSQNRGVTFTSDSLKLFVAEIGESGHAYSRVGDTFTHFWSTGSVGSGLFSTLSEDDKYLVVGTSNNVAQFYENWGGGHVLATPPTLLPGAATSQSDFSNDGVYLLMPYAGVSPSMYVYKFSGDGIDSADPQCGSWYDNTENSIEACSDKTNNDGDALIDYPADPGCTSANDPTE